MQEHHSDKPLRVPIAKLRHLLDELWQVVFKVLTTPPVSDFLSLGLSFSPLFLSLPERLAA